MEEQKFSAHTFALAIIPIIPTDTNVYTYENTYSQSHTHTHTEFSDCQPISAAKMRRKCCVVHSYGKSFVGLSHSG